MSNMCVHVVVPASNFVSVWVSAQIRREPRLPVLYENIKTVCSVPASYCFKRPFTGRTKLEKRNVIWFLQDKHLTQLTDIFLLLLVSCNFCFKKVSLMTGFTVFEPGSFKAYPRLVCFLWRAMFSELFVCATSHWREINCFDTADLASLIRLYVPLGAGGGSKREWSKQECCYGVVLLARGACVPAFSRFDLGDSCSGRSGLGW